MLNLLSMTTDTPLMKNRLCLCAFLITSSSLMAQTQEVDIDLAEFCQDQEQIDSNCSELPGPFVAFNPLFNNKTSEAEKKKTCDLVNQLSTEKIKPIEMNLKDDQGDPWKIRFHFGFTRTDIRPTDIKIRSSLVNKDFKGFEFDERTSAKHYNPMNWEKVTNALNWIDEPSNTFTLSIENKKNAFYLTAYHPKFLKTYYEEKSTDSQGNPQTTYTPGKEYISNGTNSAFASIPSGQSAVEIQNTHLLMNYQIGYGRKFTLLDNNKVGKINYIVRADMGITTGGARTIYINEQRQWIENRDKLGIQGINKSIGHRLEYQKGKVGAFIEQKYTTSTMEHGFLDGTASYKLDYSTIQFGINVDVLTMNKKDKEKKRP